MYILFIINTNIFSNLLANQVELIINRIIKGII